MTPNSILEVPEANLKNRGGRPPLPAPPQTAAETRSLIATEIVKTTPSTTKLRHLQKLLKSQEHTEEQAVTQATTERANRLLAESNEVKRAEYQRRYQIGQNKADTHVTIQLTTENNTLRETVASLQGELARVEDGARRLADERETLLRERDTLRTQNDALHATIQNLQPQADALAKIKHDVQGALACQYNADQKGRSLLAEFDSLKNGERTTTSLERMRAVLVQLKTLQHAYRVGEEVI